MTHTTIKTIALLAAAASFAAISGDNAHAKGGKDYYSQTYQFSKPMTGVEGRVGAYYCSHRTQPIYKTLPNGKKVIVGHELFQHCY